MKNNSVTEYAQFATVSQLGGPAAVDWCVKLDTGLTTLQKIAWEVTAIQFKPFLDAITSIGGYIWYYGVAQKRVTISDLEMNTAAILAMEMVKTVNNLSQGTGESFQSEAARFFPIYSLPEPVLALPQSLYAFGGAHGCDNQALVDVQGSLRIWYRAVELKESEFWDLVQLGQPLVS